MGEPIGAHAVPDDETGPSDLDLVERTRAGDSRAFAELWNRHARAGRTVARSFSYDADDIVSESFAKVLQAIRNGGGPTSAFRPYLFSTIRNVALQLKRGAQVDTSDELDALADPASEEAESLLALDKSLTAQAFRSLPTRWQEALWYSEVEQMASQEIAPLLGMTSNAVSALTFRAREGLRRAWIQAHLVRTADTECSAVIEKLGSYTRGSLGARETRKVREHLADCASCGIVGEEARDVGSRLALVLLPLVAGVAGATAYTVAMQSGAGAGAAVVAAAGTTAAHAAPATASVAHAASTSSVAHAASTSSLAHAASISHFEAGVGATTAAHAGSGAAGLSASATHPGSVGISSAVLARPTAVGAADTPPRTGAGASPGAGAAGSPAGMRFLKTAAGARTGEPRGAVARRSTAGQAGRGGLRSASGSRGAGVRSVFPRPRTAVGFAFATAAAVGVAFLLAPLVYPTPSTVQARPATVVSQGGGSRALAPAGSRTDTVKSSVAGAHLGGAKGAGSPGTPPGAVSDADGTGATGAGAGGTTGGSRPSSKAPPSTPSGSGSDAPTPDAPTPHAPTPTDPVTSTPTPTPTPDSTAPGSSTPPTVEPSGPSVPPVPPAPSAPPLPPATPPADPDPSDHSPDPPPLPPAAPDYDVLADPDGRLFPTVTGHAEPGATIEAVDLANVASAAPSAYNPARTSDHGLVAAQTTADATTGEFTFTDFPGLGFGAHWLALRQQTTSGMRSAFGPETRISLASLVLINPNTGDLATDGHYTVDAHGKGDAFFEHLTDGVSSGQTYALNSDGNFSAAFALPATTYNPGSGGGSDIRSYVVGIRYVDPDTGRHGPAASARIHFAP